MREEEKHFYIKKQDKKITIMLNTIEILSAIIIFIIVVYTILQIVL